MGRYWRGLNWKRSLEKTRVGSGRTEISVRMDCIIVSSPSSGHGPRGKVFKGVGQGWIFMFLLGGQNWKRIFEKKIGSDFVVQSSR